jgi:PPK2 family polyphosphate:nucleotide phosphotransferase
VQLRWKLDPKRKITIPINERENVEFRLKDIMVTPGRKISLKKDFDPGFTGGHRDKAGALEKVSANIERLAGLQEKLYAQDTFALLIILQAMDAAGKDGAIRHVMSGVNPQGCHVTSFKAPSAEELNHDYLWRAVKALPERGMIGIFNRSYYEEMLVVRVHPELLAKQKLPAAVAGGNVWRQRFREVNNFEERLFHNGIIPVKIFLNVSKEEQRKRFLARIDEPDKNWKFSVADCKERERWDEYQNAFEDVLNRTSSEVAPWFVIPADHKWFARLAISEAVCTVLERLHLKFPAVGEERRAELLQIRESLRTRVSKKSDEGA